FHGHAHGGEMGSAGVLAYGLGFAAATALLHAAGVALGTGLGTGAGRMAIRAAGAGTAVAGLWLAFGA
ncbi:MAG: HupE/UreJ family protein, partial [Alphaproteobacteria bacterium]